MRETGASDGEERVEDLGVVLEEEAYPSNNPGPDGLRPSDVAGDTAPPGWPGPWVRRNEVGEDDTASDDGKEQEFGFKIEELEEETQRRLGGDVKEPHPRNGSGRSGARSDSGVDVGLALQERPGVCACPGGVVPWPAAAVLTLL